MSDAEADDLLGPLDRMTSNRLPAWSMGDLHRAARNAETLRWFASLNDDGRAEIAYVRSVVLECPIEEVDETFTLPEEIEWLTSYRDAPPIGDEVE